MLRLGTAFTLTLALGFLGGACRAAGTAPAESAAAPHATGQPQVKAEGTAHRIKCVDPHACCDEAKKVIETLELITHAYAKGDLDTISAHLDDHCTTFDESTKKLVTGKENVLADIKKKIERYSATGQTPLISFTIDQPYAKVTGDTAVVTFFAYRELGGKNPVKEHSKVTDVFVKHNGTWKKLHYRGAWKKTS